MNARPREPGPADSDTVPPRHPVSLDEKKEMVRRVDNDRAWALGSSLATIGLTIPAVGLATYVIDQPLVLGLNPQNTALLFLTFLLSMLTFGTGRTNVLFGLVHMVVFAVYAFMVFVP